MVTPLSNTAREVLSNSADTLQRGSNVIAGNRFPEILREQTRTPAPTPNPTPARTATPEHPLNRPPEPDQAKQDNRLNDRTTPDTDNNMAPARPEKANPKGHTEAHDTTREADSPKEAEASLPGASSDNNAQENAQLPITSPLVFPGELMPEQAASIAALLSGIAVTHNNDVPVDTTSEELRAVLDTENDTELPLPGKKSADATLADLISAANKTDADPQSVARVKPNATATRALSAQAEPLVAKVVPTAVPETINLQSSANNLSSSNAAANTPASPLLTTFQPPSQPGPATTQLSIPTPVGQPAWAEEVGSRVMWMFGRSETRAELILNPPHLGKVEVSISITGDQTTAQFVAASQATRDALEDALPRLREVLAQAGISLGEANVGTSADDRTRDNHPINEYGAATEGSEDDGEALDAAPLQSSPGWQQAGVGLVNTFV